MFQVDASLLLENRHVTWMKQILHCEYQAHDSSAIDDEALFIALTQREDPSRPLSLRWWKLWSPVFAAYHSFLLANQSFLHPWTIQRYVFQKVSVYVCADQGLQESITISDTPVVSLLLQYLVSIILFSLADPCTPLTSWILGSTFAKMTSANKWDLFRLSISTLTSSNQSPSVSQPSAGGVI